MTALTTTQTFFDNHNMVQGSLSFVEIELRDPDNIYWGVEIATGASSKLIKGREYTVSVRSTGGDATSVGAPNALLTVGEKFVADDNNAANAAGTEITFNGFTGGKVVDYRNGDAGLKEVIQNVSSRASVVYIGAADSVVEHTAGLKKVRLILENRGYQNEAGMEHDRVGEDTFRVQGATEDSYDFTSGHAATLEKYLNGQNGIDVTKVAKADWKFVVTKFVF